jgi:hypothetical protein
MKAWRALAGLALAAAAVLPSAGLARDKTNPAELEAWAACAVERNAGDVFWVYILETGQSGLQARVRDGAYANGLGAMTRGCVPDGASFDNSALKIMMTKAYALWRGQAARTSLPRPIDAWADCVVANHPGKAKAYILARDLAFAGGPKLTVEGTDPVEDIFAPSSACDRVKPDGAATPRWTDLYARLNYLVRVKPRLPAAPSAAGEKR